jgi:hypothetical protein
MQHVEGRRVCRMHLFRCGSMAEAAGPSQIQKGRRNVPVDEEPDVGKESWFTPHAVRLQLASVVVEEVPGEVPSIQSSVQHGEWVAR